MSWTHYTRWVKLDRVTADQFFRENSVSLITLNAVFMRNHVYDLSRVPEQSRTPPQTQDTKAVSRQPEREVAVSLRELRA
jgi:hypothetical protein